MKTKLYEMYRLYKRLELSFNDKQLQQKIDSLTKASKQKNEQNTSPEIINRKHRGQDPSVDQ